MEEGKNSHHSQVFFICSMILETRISYSSLVYCLFRMQYDLFFSQMHPKRFDEKEQNVEYSIFFHQHQNEKQVLYIFIVALFSYDNSAHSQILSIS
jgi:hypothetical protein